MALACSKTKGRPSRISDLKIPVYMLSATYITDDKGKKTSVVLPTKQYQHLLEELKDIRAYDKAKAKKEMPISLRDAIQRKRKK